MQLLQAHCQNLVDGEEDDDEDDDDCDEDEDEDGNIHDKDAGGEGKIDENEF